MSDPGLKILFCSVILRLVRKYPPFSEITFRHLYGVTSTRNIHWLSHTFSTNHPLQSTKYTPHKPPPWPRLADIHHIWTSAKQIDIIFTLANANSIEITAWLSAQHRMIPPRSSLALYDLGDTDGRYSEVAGFI